MTFIHGSANSLLQQESERMGRLSRGAVGSAGSSGGGIHLSEIESDLALGQSLLRPREGAVRHKRRQHLNNRHLMGEPSNGF